MKKFLWILLILLLLGVWFLFLIKNPQLWISQTILKTLGIEISIPETASEQWLDSQTGDIFTLENLPYIYELTENSSGKLATYIKNYVSSLWTLAQGNEICPKTNGMFSTWDTFVCFNNSPLVYTTWFGNLWTWWDLNNWTPFMNDINSILESIWQLSLATFYISGTNNLSIKATFNADPNTLQILGKRISKDRNHVYCNNIVLEADPNTFEVISDTETGWIIAKDKDNNYKWCEIYSSTEEVALSDLIPNAITVEPTEFSYTNEDNIVAVKSEHSLSGFITLDWLVWNRWECNYTGSVWNDAVLKDPKIIAHFKNILSKFNTSKIIQYDLLYANKKPIWYTIDNDGNIGWRDGRWLWFIISILPNKVWYKTIDDVNKDFAICYAWGNMLPLLVSDKYILFIDSCGSWAGEPFGCTEIANKIQKTIKLN